jgi:hypothetical protein
MLRRIILIVLFLHLGAAAVFGSEKIHKYSIPICSIIINELSEGKISIRQARPISLAIANAANRHFGKITCGDMWLYMAIAHIESGFRNNVVNDYNCRGLFQVHAPSWANKFGITYTDLLNTETNADCGIQIYKYYLEQYGTVPKALSAYNSDDPFAAKRYASAVLMTKSKIKKRYTELYKQFEERDQIALRIQDPAFPIPGIEPSLKSK